MPSGRSPVVAHLFASRDGAILSRAHGRLHGPRRQAQPRCGQVPRGSAALALPRGGAVHDRARRLEVLGRTVGTALPRARARPADGGRRPPSTYHARVVTW